MRKYGFLFLSVIIIAIFFAGFFLYFVPSNKEAQNKYAFLILQNIESNLKSKIRANIELYKSHLKKPFKGSPGGFKMQQEIRNLRALDVHVISASGNQKKHTDSISGKLLDISRDSMIYGIYGTTDTLILQTGLQTVFEDILQTHKNDFFDYFLFIKIQPDKAVPVFQSEGLNLGTDIPVDSLLPGSKSGFYQGIADIPSGGVGFKMFYIPVNLGGKHFILCGFKNAQEYQESLHEVSSGFIYPIVIVLLLLVIILPLIKLSIMGAGERIRIWDFAGYFFSLFIGSMFITLMIIQVILLKDSEIRVHSDLQSISAQINSGFRQEIEKAYKLLESVDRIPENRNGFDSTQPWPKDSTLNVTNELIEWIKAQPGKDSLYYNFDRISWADSTGQQIFKGQIDHQVPLFADVSKRKYFLDFKTHAELKMPGSDSVFFTIEPLYNWIDGSFRIIIAKRSRCPHAYIVNLSAIMYSFSQSILPPGYGYCIIGSDGEVQVHSDSSHNLNENFFDELDDARALKGTIKARQELFNPGTKFYGKKNAMLVTAVNGMPYYLVTFFDTGSILPVNMRILIFSLLFCFISFSLCWLLWMVLFWRRFSSKPLLFSYMYYLNWIIPRKKNSQIYFVGSLYLVVYLLTLILASSLTNIYIPQNNHTILILLLETPVNVTGGLIIISRSLKFYQDENNKGKTMKDKKNLYVFMAMILMFVICMFLYQRLDAEVMMQFLVFELVVLGFLAYVYFNAEKMAGMKFFNSEKHLAWHTILVEAIVICLSVLPAGLFTWYAQNQEILQAAKKNQLCLAYSIDNRNNGIYGELRAFDPQVISKTVSDSLLYGRGIYPVTRQVISRGKGSIPVITADSGFEKFYFSISDQISNDYYTEGFLPALKDTSTDRSWEWTRPANGWLTFLYTLKPGKAETLKIQSEIQERFIFLSDWTKFTGLCILVCLLLTGLFFLIYRISESIFLNKFIGYGNQPGFDKLPFFKDYYASYKSRDPEEDKMKEFLMGAVFEFKPVRDEKLMYQYELQTISSLEKYRAYYEIVLENCSAAEKFLLYNFALNGFLNYKNVAEIYHLLEKGVLKVKDNEVRIFSLGFRAYLLKYWAGEGQKEIARARSKRTAWQSFKTPFLILLIAVAAFIFFTRQEAWQRFSALITGLSTAIPLLIGLFRSSFQNNTNGK